MRGNMTAQEAGQQIAQRVVPQLQELGIEAFTFAGFLTDGEGVVHKITFGYPGNNPAYADSLRKIQAVSNMWGQGVI